MSTNSRIIVHNVLKIHNIFHTMLSMVQLTNNLKPEPCAECKLAQGVDGGLCDDCHVELGEWHDLVDLFDGIEEGEGK